MFEGNRQQDAHELLHCLLDQLCHLPQDLTKRGALNHSLAFSPVSSTSGPSTSGAGSGGGDLSTGLSPPHKKARRRSERIQAQEEDHGKVTDYIPVNMYKI